MTRLLRELLAPDADASCTTALLTYFCRHPHIYLTTESLAAELGYAVDRVESSIETLIRARVIVQRRHPGLRAVMCRVAAPPWPPGPPATEFMARWQRQIRLLRDALDRYDRIAVRVARTNERVRRSKHVMASRTLEASFPRDG